jgi:hypothetical protein
MTNATQPRTFVRAINGLIALALGAYLLIAYLPVVKVFELSRADLMIRGEWIGGHAKQITAVTPGGVADRAGLKAGDVLEFDPARDGDWVLAGYREMPEGFSGTLPIRHADGSRAVVTLVPERVAYLPTLNDRLAVLARLLGLFIAMLVAVIMVWARPSLMTWSLLLSFVSALPNRPWSVYVLAFEAAGTGRDLLKLIPGVTAAFSVALLPFALCFPRDGLDDWPRWKRALFLTVLLAWAVFAAASSYVIPFVRDALRPFVAGLWISVVTLVVLAAIAALARTYRRSGDSDRARLKWTLLGMSAALVGVFSSFLLISVRSVIPNALSGSVSTPGHWVTAICYGLVLPLAIGYAVLRQRVVDVQFAVSRTLVYGLVSTLALAFLAAVHWLLGRLIEQSGLAIGLEGLAAIGLGLVLHRASHGITVLVDRLLFRKHHRAEERLRRVTAALPYASDERAIAQALVTEPVRNLNLASAALFYRDSPEGPLKRVLAQGWSDAQAASLDAASLLVRYLQAEHEPLRLDDPQLLPAGVPDGAGLPVLAIPIVNQHALAAVVLYGAHSNHTLLDPDEIELLHALAKAAATSHSQVRIAMLQREVAALSRKTEGLEREKETQQKMIERFEALVQTRMTAAGEGT